MFNQAKENEQMRKSIANLSDAGVAHLRSTFVRRLNEALAASNGTATDLTATLGSRLGVVEHEMMRRNLRWN